MSKLTKNRETYRPLPQEGQPRPKKKKKTPQQQKQKRASFSMVKSQSVATMGKVKVYP